MQFVCEVTACRGAGRMEFGGQGGGPVEVANAELVPIDETPAGVASNRDQVWDPRTRVSGAVRLETITAVAAGEFRPGRRALVSITWLEDEERESRRTGPRPVPRRMAMRSMRVWLAAALAFMVSAGLGFGQPYTYYIAATTADGGVSGSQGDDTRSAAQARSSTTPWATLSKWKSTIFDTGLMTTGDTVVVSGLIREPDGVSLNAIGAGYAAGSRYQRGGIRQWVWSDGAPGTLGTQTEQQNNIQRARFTLAQVCTGTISVTTHIGTINLTNANKPAKSGTASDIGYLTYRYYDSVDAYGRFFGHFKRAASAVAVTTGTNSFFWDGTTLTMDLTNTSTADDTTTARYEFTRNLSTIPAIIQFQGWEGHGPGGEALIDGIAFDRAVNMDSGSYLVSLESCYRAGIRNIVGHDGGHHCFGITGSGNNGCWLDNVAAFGGYGLGGAGTQNGILGGNSMASSGVISQSGFTWATADNSLTKGGGFASGQQPPVVGTVIKITGGTGATVGQLVTVTETTSATKIKVTPALTGVANGAADIAFDVQNVCLNNLVSGFEYHIYPPLGLTLTGNVANVALAKQCYGLSNSMPTAADAISSGNAYRDGTVRWYQDTLYTTTGANGGRLIGMGNRCNSYAGDLWSADTYPLLIEGVSFIDPSIMDGTDLRDVAFRRCSFSFAPTLLTATGFQVGHLRLTPNNSGSTVPIARVLLDSCGVVSNLSGALQANSGFIVVNTGSGNNQTGWTYSATNKTLSKAGGLSNCPIPRPGHVMQITGGTGVSGAAQPFTVVAATNTLITMDRTITATDGAADIAFDVPMGELRAKNSTMVCVGARPALGGTPLTTAIFAHFGAGAAPAANRGAFVELRNCVVGFDRLVSGITNRMFFQDTNLGDGSAFGSRRVASGNVYVNATAASFSSTTSITTDALFLNRATGVDRTGWAEYANAFMSPYWSAWMPSSSHPALAPPVASGVDPSAGVNRRRFSNTPGAWQFGGPLDDDVDVRGRYR